MQFALWDTLFNLLALVFWFRIWTGDDRSIVFNTYLGPVDRLGRKVLDFLDPVFFGLPPRIVSIVVLVVIVVFRGLVAPGNASWNVVVGIERTVDAASVPHALAFSALSLAVFLFKLWTLALLYTGLQARRSTHHSVQALAYLARPFTDVRVELRPLALVLTGAVLVALVDRVGMRPIQPGTMGVQAAVGWDYSPAPAVAMRLILLGLAGGIQVLEILRQVVFFLIIGSLIGLMAGAPALLAISRDWIGLFIGPLRRFPIRIGMFDLTPLLFFILIRFVYGILLSIVVSALNALP